MSTFHFMKTRLGESVLYARSSSEPFFISSVQPMDKEVEILDGCLYIGTEEGAISLMQKRKHEMKRESVMMLVSAKASKNFLLQDLCEKNDVSLIMSVRSLTDLSLAAAKTFQYYLAMSEKVESLIKVKNIGILLEELSAFLHENLILTNSSGNLLYQQGNASEETLAAVKKSFSDILYSRQMDNFEDENEERPLDYVKLFKGQTLVGILFMERVNHKPHDYQKFFRRMGPYITDFIVRDLNSKNTIQARFDYIWKDIMDGQYSSSKDIKNVFVHAGLKTKTFYRLLVIQLYEMADRIQGVFADIYPHLKELMPDSMITLYLSTIVVLNWSDQRSYDMPEWSEELEKLMKLYSCKGCIAWNTRNLSWVGLIYEFCAQEIRIAQQLNDGGECVTLVDFGNYSPYLLIDMCAQYARNTKHTKNILLLCHPAIINLYRYDQEHGTNLEEVLYYYMIHHKSLELTAQSLYMHRNTVVNKIRKIRQIVQLNLDSPEVQTHLIISHYILNYCIKIIDPNYLYKDKNDD